MSLQEMHEARVFDTELSGDKKFMVFTEGCDNFFFKALSKNEVGDLIGDLAILWRVMERE